MRVKIAIALANWDGWDFPDLAPTDALATGSEPSQEAYYELADQIHKEYMAWFLSKLKPLSDEEIQAVVKPDGSYALPLLPHIKLVAQAQLDAVKKEVEGK